MDRPRELLPLTGLRGVAAYSVLLAHALNSSGVTSPSLTALAFFGMSLFFTLSGFVIQYNYGPSFANGRAGEATKHFLLARFARLYPLYILGLVLSASFPGTAFFKNIWIALSCITLTQTWFNVHGATGDIIGGSWSISTEFFLYLLFIPFATAICTTAKPLPWLVGLCCAAIAAIAALAIFQNQVSAILAPLQFSNPKISAPPFYWLIYFSPLTRGFEFFGGAFAAQVYVKGLEPKGTNRIASLVISLCIGWCIFVVLILCRTDNAIIKTLLPNFIFAPAILTILILVCRFENLLSRLMSSKLMLTAGSISYSVYLLQGLVFVAVANAFAEGTIASAIARSIYAILITTTLGYGVYHLFEAPARSWIRSLPFGIRLRRPAPLSSKQQL
jgi:peptidoglycan/LPS O-acetylase OafA/YrhL